MEQRPSETLRRALDAAGSSDALCEALAISHIELQQYLSGHKPLPNELYLAAREILEGRRAIS
jgi:hypothetical protein